MPRTRNSSSSQQPRAGSRHTGRLVRIPLAKLRPHPANANVMTEERLAKLADNIRREGDYPPLVIRPDPLEDGYYQILDGHQRDEVLRRLGHSDALCYLWPCDDRTALMLLATLNRLEGQDEPVKRAELLRVLTELTSPEELAQLLPESASLIRQHLELLDLDLDALLADLQTEPGPGSGLRAITFAVTPSDEAVIEEAVGLASANLDGKNRRGRALGIIVKGYLERRSG